MPMAREAAVGADVWVAGGGRHVRWRRLHWRHASRPSALRQGQDAKPDGPEGVEPGGGQADHGGGPKRCGQKWRIVAQALPGRSKTIMLSGKHTISVGSWSNCGQKNHELFSCRGVAGNICTCKTMGPGSFMNYYGKNHGPGPMYPEHDPEPPPPSGWGAHNP